MTYWAQDCQVTPAQVALATLRRLRVQAKGSSAFYTKMAAPAASSEEDPLTAALPPVTDYITYLTILEYRLNPSNLSTLNSILDRDDGTLAKEIGWDLLRLVLPMLTYAPQDAARCLDTISRRGNPREVVVRVAEELEKLGRHDGDEDEDDEFSEGDGLPTFEGEAERIHLGDMKLDGMPESQRPTTTDQDEAQNSMSAIGSSAALEALEFPALLKMLSTVHPRIKTQYPSRFLATSLPAAMAAYRRMTVSNETTCAFLECLEKLGSKQRPALPPRNSTNGTTAVQFTATSLPDPEAPAEASEGTNVASQLEKDIIARLLQAVLLEVLEEYSGSWQRQDVPSMIWTKRLREQLGGEKALSKPTAVAMAEISPLKEREGLLKQFLQLGTTLGLEPGTITTTWKSDDAEQSAVQQADEPSEYPTSPTQIPLSKNATVLFLAAQSFSGLKDLPTSGFTNVLGLYRSLTPLSEMPSVPSPSVQDALHSLLYRDIFKTPVDFVDGADRATFIELISILTQTFTISPEPQSRDDAHHLAQTLFHARSSSDDKVAIVEQTIRCSTGIANGTSATPLATPFTEGALRAVGVNWLKDSLVASIMADASTGEPTGIGLSRLETDDALNELIWRPNIPSLTDTHLISNILLALPYYTALLNLSNVLIKRADLVQHPSVLDKSRSLLQRLTPWCDHLVAQLSSNEEVKDSTPEVYAFEDAVGRVQKALESTVNLAQST